jgi:hypothetical protein
MCCFDLCDGLMDECINFVSLVLIWTSSSRTWWSWSSRCMQKQDEEGNSWVQRDFFLFLEGSFSFSWYCQPRLKGWVPALGAPLVSVGNTNRD